MRRCTEVSPWCYEIDHEVSSQLVAQEICLSDGWALRTKFGEPDGWVCPECVNMGEDQ